ncbi:uncharacterized protein EI90DRAFT_3129570 [Cantharellus anzutake]|uniref:uncharacterized protein n=1 Tax=Cantharellus anzutake TaxID=1750568 RepID=UPI001904B077|nr:uncharacterized protein EI90DRAFT_3129570 [Cantharellus anzutake]KAF8324789.1 hypothetical protein EI90DRAFT_3129570 [Cantharellus anzutake]
MPPTLSRHSTLSIQTSLDPTLLRNPNPSPISPFSQLLIPIWIFSVTTAPLTLLILGLQGFRPKKGILSYPSTVTTFHHLQPSQIASAPSSPTSEPLDSAIPSDSPDGHHPLISIYYLHLPNCHIHTIPTSTPGSRNSETDSGALLPFHHLLLANSQEVIPPPALTPPLVRLRNILGPTSTSTPSRQARNTYAPNSGPPLQNPVHISISGTSGLSSNLGL